MAGDRDSYGKDFAGDIVEGKRTLMLIHLFKNAAPAERARLQEILRPPLRRSDAARTCNGFSR